MVNGTAGENPDDDVSVPINWAYNHHYMLWMTGKDSVMKEIEIPSSDIDQIWYNHGLKTEWVAVDLPSAKLRANPEIPTSQLFSEGNGGESRKSYHGYPAGYAQLIESPQSYHLTPMQIDTRNRDCGATSADINNCTQFIPGIEPKQARYGRKVIPEIGTNYSGLLECPCNGKFGGDPMFYGNSTLTKTVTHNYMTLQTQQCESGETIMTQSDCQTAISQIFNGKTIKMITDNTSMPYGCSIYENTNNNNVIYGYFNDQNTNNNGNQEQCSISSKMFGSTSSNVGIDIKLELDTEGGNVTFTHSPKGEYCSKNHQNVLGKYPSASNSESDQQAALNKCEEFCKSNSKCTVCSVDCSLSGPSTGQCQWVALPTCGSILHYNGPNGLIEGDISWKEGGIINITISGPSNVWFGVGFDATVMADSPWTLITNSSGVWEQKIGTCGSEAEHCPGYQLNKTITILSNTVNNGIRTVIVQRGLIGKTSEYYSFIPSDAATIPLITAIGQSQTFAYHAAHANTIISLVASDNENTCVCDTGANGKMCEQDGTGCKTFVKNCVSYNNDLPPSGSLLQQDNPTCNSRQYSGGLSCCINGHNLLDADQEIPPQLLKYHMKFRFWFQEYIPQNSTNPTPSHYNLDRIYQQTEANAGEYDIPPAFSMSNMSEGGIVGYPNWPLNKPTPGTHCSGDCPNGNDCECYHEIQYRWIESPSKPMRLIYAGGHCHAPACISLTLYRNDTGEVLCSQIPQYGKGNVDKDKYDEAGYILIPPCLWGNETGLNPSVLLPAGTPLLSIKRNRNTHIGHFGEMASWQMRGTFF